MKFLKSILYQSTKYFSLNEKKLIRFNNNINFN